MANDARTAGFMQQLGLNIPAAPAQNEVPGGNLMATAANISRSAGRGPATQLLGGLVSGIGGQISGQNGRGLRQFGRDFSAGIQDVNDINMANDLGITPEMVRIRRALMKELGDVNLGGGSLEEQINAAEMVARKANQMGDIQVAFKAAEMRAALEKQLQEQRKAGIETDQAELELEEDEALAEIGMQATLVGKDSLGEGKAVRITPERARDFGLSDDTIGKFLFLDSNGQRHIVSGAEVVPLDSTFAKYGVGGIAPKDDNVLTLAAKNGATPGQIGKLRGTLDDMGRQAGLVADVADLLMSMENPELALDLTGKTAIQANRVVRFVDNAATILTEADHGTGSGINNTSPYKWRGKEVSGEADVHANFVQRGKDQSFLLGTLNKLAGESGVPQKASLADYLPTQILDRMNDLGWATADIARVAEQYWANVMELAYMDARLHEPSNRGLSDNDIENALRRIAAHTANPRSLAERQNTLLRRVDDALQNLGSTLTVPVNARTRVEDVRNFIYSPEVVLSTRRSVLMAQSKLEELMQHGPYAGKSPKVDDILSRRAKGETITRDELAALTDEEAVELQRRVKGK